MQACDAYSYEDVIFLVYGVHRTMGRFSAVRSGVKLKSSAKLSHQVRLHFSCMKIDVIKCLKD